VFDLSMKTDGVGTNVYMLHAIYESVHFANALCSLDRVKIQ